MKWAALGCLIVIAGLATTCGILIHKNAKLKIAYNLNVQALNAQNAAIKQARLDSEAYHCDIESLNDYTRSRYAAVIHTHENESCEAKLKSFEQALGIFTGEQNGQVK